MHGAWVKWMHPQAPSDCIVPKDSSENRRQCGDAVIFVGLGHQVGHLGHCSVASESPAIWLRRNDPIIISADAIPRVPLRPFTHVPIPTSSRFILGLGYPCVASDDASDDAEHDQRT